MIGNGDRQLGDTVSLPFHPLHLLLYIGFTNAIHEQHIQSGAGLSANSTVRHGWVW